MNNQAGIGLTTAILLISFILIAATAVSVITGNNNPKTISEKKLEKIVDDILDEISIYIQIKDAIGKYYPTEGGQRIKKIATLIKPLTSLEIDISESIVKICNGEQIKILRYSGHAEFIHSHPLFEHPIWNNIENETFSFIVTLDKDRSITDHNTINDNTDMAYIIIKLSEDFAMKKGDRITTTFFPAAGIEKTITLEAPLPMKKIVKLN